MPEDGSMSQNMCGFAITLGSPMWECLHMSLMFYHGMVTVRLYVYLHHHCETLGTILGLLEPVDDGPKKGRNVYGKSPGAARTATGEVRRAVSG
jgi:hypothetical protein